MDRVILHDLNIWSEIPARSALYAKSFQTNFGIKDSLLLFSAYKTESERIICGIFKQQAAENYYGFLRGVHGRD